MITVITALLSSSLAFAHNGTGPVIDKDGNEIFHAQLTHNIAPTMPPTATESGYCCVFMDITANGRVKNPKVLYCSSPVFWNVTERTMSKITYDPQLINGESHATLGHLEYFSFRLYDELGQVIQNAEGYPKFRKDGEHVAEHYCRSHVS